LQWQVKNRFPVIYFFVSIFLFTVWKISFAKSEKEWASFNAGLPSGNNPNSPGYRDSMYKLSSVMMRSSSGWKSIYTEQHSNNLLNEWILGTRSPCSSINAYNVFSMACWAWKATWPVNLSFWRRHSMLSISMLAASSQSLVICFIFCYIRTIPFCIISFEKELPNSINFWWTGSVWTKMSEAYFFLNLPRAW